VLQLVFTDKKSIGNKMIQTKM